MTKRLLHSLNAMTNTNNYNKVYWTEKLNKLYNIEEETNEKKNDKRLTPISNNLHKLFFMFSDTFS